MSRATTYKDSGVDITVANDLITDFKAFAKKTGRKEVLSGIGGFAGLFSIKNFNFKNPTLVACTDGVGTKLKLAIEAQHLANLGQDLVAMCVNDLICSGAEPLFFLDYFATGKLEPAACSAVIQSIAVALEKINCTLLGGETAEMPGLYQNNDFDIAGFAVGIVDQENIIDGKKVAPGDHIIGIASSGAHSNGYSLIRHILHKKSIALDSRPDFAKHGLAKTLLAPTRLYVNPILKTLKKHTAHALAHITGGGLVENLPRVFSQNLCAVIDKKFWTIPPLFRFLQEQGQVPEPEMWRVFNMGIGFVLIAPALESKKIVKTLCDLGESAQVIGSIEKQKTKNETVIIC